MIEIAMVMRQVDLRIVNRSVRRSFICAVGMLGATCTLAVGCAGTGSTAMGRSKTKSSVAEVVAYGGEINLRATDVPKFVIARFPRSRTVMTGPFGASVERCDGVTVGAHEVVGLRSHRFQDTVRSPGDGDDLIPRESVQSAVYVMTSAGMAYREVVAAMSSRGLQCMEHATTSKNVLVKPEGSGAGVPLLNNVKILNVRLCVDGVPIECIRTAARETIEPVGPSGVANYYQDLWAFASGRTVVLLTTVGSPQPFPTAEEHRLLSILYSRAKADNSLGVA